MRRFTTLLLSLLLLLSLSVTAMADSGVTYQGPAKEFIFTPGGEENPTDLFPGFKNVIPGDTITEQIVIKNDAAKGVKVNVFLRALGSQESMEGLLSQMKLTVKQKDDSVLFAAPANETAQLTDWVYLGTVYSGGEIALDVTLEVPIEMGNEYQNQTGYIDWEFSIEEFPAEDSDPKPPKTADNSNLPLYVALLVMSLTAMTALLLPIKKKSA